MREKVLWIIALPVVLAACGGSASSPPVAPATSSARSSTPSTTAKSSSSSSTTTAPVPAQKQTATASTTKPAPVPSQTSPAPAPSAARFANCADLNAVYPHGVGLPGAVDHTSGTPVTTFTQDKALYQANSGLDADRDSIACEKK